MVRRTKLGLVLTIPNGLMAAASNCMLLRLVGMSLQLPPAADEKQLPMLRAASGSGNPSPDLNDAGSRGSPDIQQICEGPGDQWCERQRCQPGDNAHG